MPLSKKLKIFLISTLLIIVYIISDIFFKESAFEDSNNFVIHLQSTLSSYFFEVFFKIFCDILNPMIAATLLTLYYALTLQKIKTLSFILYFILITYFCSIVKIIYHDPRPYWTNHEVQAFECYSEFGNPSGHSMLSILLCGMIWMRYVWALVKYGEVGLFLKKEKKKKNINPSPFLVQQVQQNGYETAEIIESSLEIKKDSEIKTKENSELNKNAVFIAFSICLLIIEFFILFGRIYLGMHSYNEVLLGLFYGLYFLIVYYLYIEKIIMETLDSIIMRNYRFFLKGTNFDWKICIILVSSYVFSIIIPIVLFEIYNKKLVYPQIWRENILRACPDNSSSKMFLNKCFTDCGLIGTIFGVLLGIFLTKGEYYSLKIIYMSDENKNFLSLDKISWKKHFLRVVVVFVFAGAIGAVLSVIPNNDSVYIGFFVNNLLSTTISGFLLIKLVPFINHLFKIEYEKDFLKYNNGDLVVYANNTIGYEEFNK